AAKARTSILKVHRQDEHADYTLLVAPEFEGGSNPKSNLGKTCRNDKVTPIRVDDLARLIELFPFRGISPATLRPLFDLRLPKDCHDFVEKLETEKPEAPPLELVL